MTRQEAQKSWEKIVAVGCSDYDSLTKDQKIWFNIEPLTTDGIIDHYINHGADHNGDTIEALEYLGFSDIASLLRKINSLFKNGTPPSDILKRNKEWNQWSDRHESLFDETDKIFWSRVNDLESKLLDHINQTKIGIAK